MKRILFVFVLILALGISAFLVTGIISKTHRIKAVRERIKTFPSFSMITINDSVFESIRILKGPILLIFFHPECEHCQYEIADLFKHWDFINDSQVILISNAEKRVQEDFFKKLKLNEYHNLSILIDKEYKFKDFFGTESVPTTFIYNRNLKLLKYFLGEVKMESVLKYLLQNG